MHACGFWFESILYDTKNFYSVATTDITNVILEITRIYRERIKYVLNYLLFNIINTTVRWGSEARSQINPSPNISLLKNILYNGGSIRCWDKGKPGILIIFIIYVSLDTLNWIDFPLLKRAFLSDLHDTLRNFKAYIQYSCANFYLLGLLGNFLELSRLLFDYLLDIFSHVFFLSNTHLHITVLHSDTLYQLYWQYSIICQLFLYIISHQTEISFLQPQFYNRFYLFIYYFFWNRLVNNNILEINSQTSTWHKFNR